MKWYKGILRKDIKKYLSYDYCLWIFLIIIGIPFVISYLIILLIPEN